MLYSYDLIVLLRVFTLFYEYHFHLNVQPLVLFINLYHVSSTPDCVCTCSLIHMMSLAG